MRRAGSLLRHTAKRFRCSRFWRDQRGVSGTEYGLMIAGFVCVIIAALALVGTRESGMFNHLATVLQ